MSVNIQKVVVIGSGVMGAAIAAHVANSGTPVVLLDIVPKEGDRSALAKGAIERLLKTDPAPLVHKKKAKLITPGNLEDDLGLIGDADWIIEVVLENLEIKKNLYKKINTVRKPRSIVSSNTSTIPLHLLVEDMSAEFQKHFMVTHFFNPPRYMQLLELVTGAETSPDAAEMIREFCDVKLGKGVVHCKDTPGFIANRIGCFWMTAGVLEAMRLGVTVEEADLVMGRPAGIPKTGVFGLLDLIGIDLMPLIAKEFSKTLPATDPFIQIYKEPELVTKMIADGCTGRKGKGGFYRLNTGGGGRKKETIDLKTGEYRASDKPKLSSVDAAKSGLRQLLDYDDIGGKYARAVWLQVLGYAASLVPEIAESITDVDEAMRLGYNWKYGPFELIDKLGCDKVSGPKWLANALKQDSKNVPELFEKAGDKPFYKTEGGQRSYLGTDGAYHTLQVPAGAWMLADKKLGNKPILKNPSASLWDIGDGIVCLEYTSKMNSVDPMVLEMMEQAVELVAKEYKGLVIANDSDNFCVGANIGILLFGANVAAWKDIRKIIKQGQDAYMKLKFAPFPVVTAVSGMALGGGCEILMHSDAVQAHIETYTGLVEVGVGIIPGWGGCKEMLIRHLDSESVKRLSAAKMGGMFALSVKQAAAGEGSASLKHPIKTLNTMPAIIKAFENIGTAKVAKSAEEARDLMILLDKDAITMNRRRLLSDAKQKCLSLVEGYRPPEMRSISLPGKTARTALYMAIDGFVKNGKATAYDEVVSKALATVLSGGDTDITRELSEQDLLDLELDVFMELVRKDGTLARLEAMLETGKPLRN